MKQYGKKKKKKTRKCKDWFDAECSDERNAFNRARRSYKDNKRDETLEQMKLAGKEYETIVNKFKAAQRNTFVEEFLADIK